MTASGLLRRQLRPLRSRTSIVGPALAHNSLVARTVANTARTRTSQTAFWTTGRAVLFASFSASLAYLFGTYDASSKLALGKENQAPATIPKYATKPELEKVRGLIPTTPQLSEDVNDYSGCQ